MSTLNKLVYEIADASHALRNSLSSLVARADLTVQKLLEWTEKHDKEDQHWSENKHFRMLVAFANIAMLFVCAIALLVFSR